MTLQKLFPILKDVQGKSIPCQCGCRRMARHIHHIKPRCEGGSDDPNNLLFLCQKCHVRHHSKQGDFARWGKQGGEITAERKVSMPNLKQFQGPKGRACWEAYCAKQAAQQMGLAS